MKEVEQIWRIKGLPKNHPANKDFNEFMQKKNQWRKG